MTVTTMMAGGGSAVLDKPFTKSRIGNGGGFDDIDDGGNNNDGRGRGGGRGDGNDKGRGRSGSGGKHHKPIS